MERKNKFAVLAIGTEVTSGQIINRNTSLMSSWMENLGFQTVMHIGVPDDRPLILEGLKLCTEKAEFVFTCGGLGPTTDDFTREVIADFLGLKLVFDQGSLDKILEKMRLMGRNFLQSQKQQCFYPQGSEILWNSAGTANGFFLDMSEFKLAVLPGPPNEIAAIWENGLKNTLDRYAPKNSKTILKKWNCMGRPEAELAEIVEELVKGSKLKTGYRLNAPYVEVKLWCDPLHLESQERYFDAIEAKLGQWIILRDDENPWNDFWRLIAGLQSVSIVDEASEGFLSSRLSELFRQETKREKIPKLTLVTGRLETSQSKSDLAIHVYPFNNNGEFELHLLKNNLEKRLTLRSPFQHNLSNDRSRLAASELTILAANKFLSEMRDTGREP